MSTLVTMVPGWSPALSSSPGAFPTGVCVVQTFVVKGDSLREGPHKRKDYRDAQMSLAG